MIATVFGHAAGPFALNILRAHPCGGLGHRSRAVGCFGVKRAGERHGLNNCGVITAGHKCHQAAHTACMIDQCAQIGARALSAGTFKHNAAKSELCKMVVERLVVLNVNFAAALRDLVQRRLRDEEMAVFDNFGHLAIEECQQQCTDM